MRGLSWTEYAFCPTESPLQTMDLKQSKTAISRARKYGKGDVQYLNEEELVALFRSIDSQRDVAIFEVAFHRGLRASEVGLLQLADLRLSAKRLNVRRVKGGASGEYPITDREARALREWILIRGQAPGALFLSLQGLSITRSRLDQLMKGYGARAGIPESKRHFHCLRHTAGTMLSEKADLADVKDHLGHKDIRSTMKYVVVRSKRRNDLGERMAGVFGDLDGPGVSSWLAQRAGARQPGDALALRGEGRVKSLDRRPAGPLAGRVRKSAKLDFRLYDPNRRVRSGA